VFDPLVRPAEPHDAVALADLEMLAREALVDARGGRRWLDEHPLIGAGWTAAIAARDVFVAVLDTGQTVMPVGYLVLDRIGPVANVDQVFVLPEARELGFGDALLARAVEHGRASGATLIEGQALPGDRDTKNLYERAAITARLITVSKRL
jgi:GNAT superfamily N-acetyltransferase